MIFYRLITPEYASDPAYEVSNPLFHVEEARIPSLICEVCHKLWAGNRYLHQYQVSDWNLLDQLRKTRTLPEVEWLKLVDRVRVAVSAKSIQEFRPGDILGLPLMKPFHRRAKYLGVTKSKEIQSHAAGDRSADTFA
jgi:hypothetical protein